MVRVKGTMTNIILQGKVESKRSQGRPARQWLDDAKEWTRLSFSEMWRETDDRVAGENMSIMLPPSSIYMIL